MSEAKTMSGLELTQYLDTLTDKLKEYSGLYQAEVGNLTAAQNERIEAQKDENEIKNNLKILRDKISQVKSEIANCKYQIKSECNG